MSFYNLAHTRERAVSKLRDLLKYCNMNSIIPQYTKCEFMVINGNEADKRPIEFGTQYMKQTECIRHALRSWLRFFPLLAKIGHF